MWRRTQTGLEYIILIGGIVIFAAAGYFVVKGFVLSGGESTRDTIRGSDVSREDLLNLGLEAVTLPGFKWYSTDSFIKTSFTLSNTGDVSAKPIVSMKKSNFSSNGANLDEFEVGYLKPVSGEYSVLNSSDNGTDFVFESPIIPPKESLEVVLHYNNSSPYTPVTGFDHAIDDPDVVVVEGSVESVVKTDFVPPVFNELSIDNPEAGVGEPIMFSVPVNETSRVSEASFRVVANLSTGNFSTTVYDVDGLYHFVTGLPGGSLQLKGTYVSGSLVFEMLAFDAGEYSFFLTVEDEWGNKAETVVVLNVSDEGTGEGGDGEGGGFLPGCTEPVVNLENKTVFDAGDDLACGCSSPGAEEYPCDPGNDGSADGFCWLGECVYIRFDSFQVNPSFILLTDTVTFSVGFSNASEVSSCSLTVDAAQYEMSLSGQTAEYSDTFPPGDSEAVVTCTDVYSHQESVSKNFTVTYWEDEVRLVDNNDNQRDPKIAASGPNVHLVWYDGRTGWDVYYKNSSDNGATWSSDYRLTNNAADAFSPAVAVYGDNVYVVWKDYRTGPQELFFKNSSDSGSTWSGDTQLTSGAVIMNLAGDTPGLAVSGSNLHLVWTDRRDSNGREVYYKNSSDGGLTWTSDYRLSDSDTQYSEEPAIAASGSNVHVVWKDERFYPSPPKIFYKNSSDNGITWSSDYQLSQGSDYTSKPWVAVSGDQVHVVWSGSNEIYYKKSDDGGTTWSADKKITQDAQAGVPVVAVSGSDVYLFWQDYQYSPSEIGYARSSDSGDTWSPAYRMTFGTQGTKTSPTLATSGQYAHLVWVDERFWSTHSEDLYYMRQNPS